MAPRMASLSRLPISRIGSFPRPPKDAPCSRMQPHRFILQAFDPDYGHPAFETMFAVERLEELQALLGAAAGEDPELEMVYTLDPGDVDAINHRFGLAFDPSGRVSRLTKWTSNREPPYLVHTGFELVLMIDGRKPFT